MAVAKRKGFMSNGKNDLRFLDGLDHDYEYTIQKPAFSLPALFLTKELPKIAVRPPQWYEKFCCSQSAFSGRGLVSRKRKPRPKRKPAPASLPKINTATQNSIETKTPVATDDCLLPLIPVPNPMPCLRILHIPHEPPSLPSGIQAVRLLGTPLWGPSEPSTWNRPAVLQRSAYSSQPPWAHSRTQLWNKSVTLQPGWARNLICLGRMLQEIGNRKGEEAEALALAKGEVFGMQFAKKCLGLNRLTGDCIQLLEQQGKSKQNLRDVA